MRPFRLGLAILCLSSALAAAPVPVGAARIDITPELPIRLTGYTNRPTEADRVGERIQARALAIGGDAEGPALVIVAELLAVRNVSRRRSWRASGRGTLFRASGSRCV